MIKYTGFLKVFMNKYTGFLKVFMVKYTGFLKVYPLPDPSARSRRSPQRRINKGSVYFQTTPRLRDPPTP